MKTFPSLLPAFFGLLLLSGCDSFSLLDQLSTQALALAVQSSSLEQNSSVSLFPSGGTPPYSFAALADNVAYSGTMGAFTPSPYQYTSGTSIGSIRLRVYDARGASADALVTVRPPPPTLPGVSNGSGKDTITWTYSTPSFVDRFSLSYGTDGVNYNGSLPDVASTSSKTYSTVRNGAGSGGNYYKIYAVAGSFQSLPVTTH